MKAQEAGERAAALQRMRHQTPLEALEVRLVIFRDNLLAVRLSTEMMRNNEQLRTADIVTVVRSLDSHATKEEK